MEQSAELLTTAAAVLVACACVLPVTRSSDKQQLVMRRESISHLFPHLLFASAVHPRDYFSLPFLPPRRTLIADSFSNKKKYLLHHERNVASSRPFNVSRKTQEHRPLFLSRGRSILVPASSAPSTKAKTRAVLFSPLIKH